MKIPLVSSSLLIVTLCGTLPSWAQPTNLDTNLRDRNELANNERRLGKLEKATQIIGLQVKDSQNQKLGKVHDLAIDLQNGRIVEVIVATGGVLGLNEKYMAVPPGQFTCDVAQKTLQLNADKDRFTKSPAFRLSAWDEDVRKDNVGLVYQYYNAKPYFMTADQPASTSGGLGVVERASKVIGRTVHNTANDKVGTVENLVVDLPTGRIVEVVLSSGGFLGMGDALSAVPPQSFHRDADHEQLILDTTKEALSQAPHFKSGEWPDLTHPVNDASAVYRAYKVDPYFSTNAVDNTAQNVRDRQDNALTPLSQGNSEADVNTTKQIRQGIMAVDGLSMDARNIKVITIDGRVTLRGPVDSPEEKRQVSDIAAKFASQANVDNQLQVKGDSNSVK